MSKISYYILGWYDEGSTNRSKVLWRGSDSKSAEEQFNAIKFTDGLFFVELYETCYTYDEDVRLDYKCI